MSEVKKPLPAANADTKPVPRVRRVARPVPEETPMTKPEPEDQELNKAAPESRELDKEQPQDKSLDKPQPPTVNPENVIRVGDQDIEIKPTRLLYQRNGTASAYRILDIYPLPDILSTEAGVLDPKRDGDAIVFDFLIAVFDDKDLVAEHYDDFTAEDVDRAVKIFKRLNHIEDKEEAAKNRAAKGTSR